MIGARFIFIYLFLFSGLSPLERKIAQGLKATLKFSVDGDQITTKLHSGPIKNKVKFRLGEEYEHKYMGRAFKVKLYRAI